MNEHLGVFYRRKNFLQKNKMPKILGLKQNVMINNIHLNNDLYSSYQQYYFFLNNNFYTNGYNNYSESETKLNYDDYDYYASNNNHITTTKIYSTLSKSIKNGNNYYRHIKTHNIHQNYLNNYNSFNYKKNYNSYTHFDNNFVNCDLYHTKCNSLNHLSVYNNYSIPINGSMNFNTESSSEIDNGFRSIDYIPLNINSFNSKSLYNFDINSQKKFSTDNFFKINKNQIYINTFNERNTEKIEQKNIQFKKINNLKGKVYIAQQGNHENVNNILYVSEPKKNIKKNESFPYYNKRPQKDNKQFHKIQINTISNDINQNKQLFKTKSNIPKINIKRILPKVKIIINKASREIKRCKINNVPSKPENEKTNITNFITKFSENKYNEQIKDKSKNITRNIKSKENTDIKKNLSIITKINKFPRKKLNTNLPKTNLISIDRHKKFKKESKKSLQSPFSYNVIKTINNTQIKNSEEKKGENISTIPPSNNVLVISTNISENKKVIPISAPDSNIQIKHIKSFLTDKTKRDIKKNLFNQGKAKKRCELCKALVFSYLYKVHQMCHPSQILKFLFLGNFVHATNYNDLAKLKINYILNCASECFNYNLPKNIEELHLDVRDEENFEIIKYFETANEFINKCKLKGGICLVHCKLGVSRSTTFVMAYLIRYHKLGVDEAFEFVKKKRISIKPNAGFIRQLYEYEKMVKKN